MLRASIVLVAGGPRRARDLPVGPGDLRRAQHGAPHGAPCARNAAREVRAGGPRTLDMSLGRVRILHSVYERGCSSHAGRTCRLEYMSVYSVCVWCLYYTYIYVNIVISNHGRALALTVSINLSASP